jgi:hypothetical protein
MSHVVSIKAKLNDLVATKAAFARLGGTWQEGQATYRWYSQYMGDYPLPEGWTKADVKWLGKCTHAVRFPGARYEVGVLEVAKLPPEHPARRTHKDGEVVVLYDFWSSGGLNQFMGDGSTASKFVQAYQVEKAKAAARRKGLYGIKETTAKDGSIVLEINT